jgi:hypothetical protein
LRTANNERVDRAQVIGAAGMVNSELVFRRSGKCVAVDQIQAQGQFVRVQLSGTNYLSLAKVQVFGQ